MYCLMILPPSPSAIAFKKFIKNKSSVIKALLQLTISSSLLSDSAISWIFSCILCILISCGFWNNRAWLVGQFMVLPTFFIIFETAAAILKPARKSSILIQLLIVKYILLFLNILLYQLHCCYHACSIM